MKTMSSERLRLLAVRRRLLAGFFEPPYRGIPSSWMGGEGMGVDGDDVLVESRDDGGGDAMRDVGTHRAELLGDAMRDVGTHRAELLGDDISFTTTVLAVLGGGLLFFIALAPWMINPPYPV
jgi:hypothetical protein